MTRKNRNPPQNIPSDEQAQKNIAYFTEMLSAWKENRMEADKALLTLSGGGIALLVTLLSTNASLTNLDKSLCGLALAFFLLAILGCIMIFKLNARHIEDVLLQKAKGSRILRNMDHMVLVLFLVGVSLSISFAYTNAAHKNDNTKEGSVMAKQGDRGDSSQGRQKLINDSIDGIGKLNPNTTTTSQGGSTKNSNKSSSNSQTRKN